MVANSYAGKDSRGTTDPYVVTKSNRRNPRWTRRFQGMMVGVENCRQVSDQTIVTDLDAMIGYDGCTSVDENLLADHKGTIFGGTYFDWYGLAAETQASACDRPTGDKHRTPSVYSDYSRSRARPTEYGRGPEAGRHVTDLKH
jgi:hypothetical protein